MKLSEQIIEARKINGGTQESLAKSTNLSLRTIQRIEKGKGTPRTHTLKILSSSLGIELLNKDAIFVSNSTKENNTILLITYTTIICSFVPLINLCPSISLWLKNQNSERIHYFAKKVFHSQVISFTIFMISIFLIPLISLFRFDQVAMGNTHTFQIIYLLFVVINITTTIWLYMRTNQAYNNSIFTKTP